MRLSQENMKLPGRPLGLRGPFGAHDDLLKKNEKLKNLS
jgi:hypothetical protein